VTGFANLVYLDTRAAFFARKPAETTRVTGFNVAHFYGMRYEVSTQSPGAAPGRPLLAVFDPATLQLTAIFKLH